MKRYILLLADVLAPIIIFSQTLTFNSEIINSKNPEINAISDLWRSYVINLNVGSDGLALQYWNYGEREQGYNDIILAVCQFPTYLIGNLEVFEINKANDEWFQIRNRLSFNNNLFAEFKVYARITTSGYKLYNCLYLSKLSLQNFRIDNIYFYYPDNYPFDPNKATKVAKLYSDLSEVYGLNQNHIITYLIGNNLYEANQLLGFDYTLMNSSSSSAAYYIKDPKIIVASNEEKEHEIVHSVFYDLFPDASSFFHEGIATFYGGSAGKSYNSLLHQLNKYISENPNTNLSNLDDFNEVNEDGTNYYYIVGAIFIDYTIKTYGVKKVIALFQSPVTDKYSSTDALSTIQAELKVPKYQINSFIRNILNDFD